MDITLSGYEEIGFMVPVFEFDGADSTEIDVREGCITVKYQGAVCRYLFEGEVDPDYRYCYNRNGRYRVYAVAAQKLHIEMRADERRGCCARIG